MAPLVARTGTETLSSSTCTSQSSTACTASRCSARSIRASRSSVLGTEDPESIEAALSAGAAAYVYKSIDLADLPALLRQALNRKAYFSLPPGIGGTLTRLRSERAQEQVRDRTGLTRRELEILGAVSRGLSNREVARELFLSDQTVKFHLHNIYGKLGVSNRTEATAAAHGLGLAGSV